MAFGLEDCPDPLSLKMSECWSTENPSLRKKKPNRFWFLCLFCDCSLSSVLTEDIMTIWPVDCERLVLEASNSPLRILQPTQGSPPWLSCFSLKTRHCERPDKRGYESKLRRRCAQDSNHITRPEPYVFVLSLIELSPGWDWLTYLPVTEPHLGSEAGNKSNLGWLFSWHGLVWNPECIPQPAFAPQFHFTGFIAVNKLVRGLNLYCLIWNNCEFYWRVCNPTIAY